MVKSRAARQRDIARARAASPGYLRIDKAGDVR